MNRGAGRRAVFITRGDGLRFEQLIGVGCSQVGVEVHAYCFMSNHYHLLVHCPEAGLSTFMQRLSSSYTRMFNTAHDRDGPLFRSRFHSRSIDSPNYLVRVGRYIHRNPLDATDGPLQEYRWSSYRAYLAISDSPPWLTTSTLLDASADDRAAYGRFVESATSGVTVDVASVHALVDLVVEEHTDDSVHRQAVQRALTVAVADRLDPVLARAVVATLGYPTRAALRTARSRARRATRVDPAFGAMVDRVIHLAA